MLVNSALWKYLNLDNAYNHLGASACVYIGMTPEQIKALLEPRHTGELLYKLSLARELGFNEEKDMLRVNNSK